MDSNLPVSRYQMTNLTWLHILLALQSVRLLFSKYHVQSGLLSLEHLLAPGTFISYHCFQFPNPFGISMLQSLVTVLPI